MKTTLARTHRASHLALALALLSTLNPQLSTLFAQGTAFTYQGRLLEGTNLANGSHDLRFILFDVDQFGFPISYLAEKPSGFTFSIGRTF